MYSFFCQKLELSLSKKKYLHHMQMAFFRATRTFYFKLREEKPYLSFDFAAPKPNSSRSRSRSENLIHYQEIKFGSITIFCIKCTKYHHNVPLNCRFSLKIEFIFRGIFSENFPPKTSAAPAPTSAPGSGKLETKVGIVLPL